jgi:hypothetical protein
MIAKLKMGRLNLRFVFNHQWEDDGLMSRLNFKPKRLGLWWRRELAVGVRKAGRAAFDRDNLVPSYQVGLDLIVCRVWLSWDLGVKHFKLEEQ